MTLLAVAYLAVQYMLALRQTVVPVGARRRRGRRAVPAHRRELDLTAFATIVLALQCVAAAGMLALGLRARRAHAATAPSLAE